MIRTIKKLSHGGVGGFHMRQILTFVIASTPFSWGGSYDGGDRWIDRTSESNPRHTEAAIYMFQPIAESGSPLSAGTGGRIPK